MVKIKKIVITNMLWRCEATRTLIKIWNGATNFENLKSLNKLNIYNIKSNNVTLMYSPQGNKNISWHKNLHTNVYS